MVEVLGEDTVKVMELNAQQKGSFEFGRFKISYEEENIKKELIEEEISQDRYVRTRFDEQFYIDKEGKIWKYKIKNIEEIVDICSVHEKLAQQILEKRYHTKYYEPFKSAKDCIMNLGFIIIGAVCGQEPPFSQKEPTQSQLDAMFDLGYILKNDNNFFDRYYFKRK